MEDFMTTDNILVAVMLVWMGGVQVAIPVPSLEQKEKRLLQQSAKKPRK